MAGFQAFIDLAKYLGLQLSIQKCVPPTTSVEWLGYHIDTVKISIPQQKLAEVLEECQAWFHRRRVTRTMVQSLAGRLSHVAGYVQHGRKFLTRILGALGADNSKKLLTFNEDFLKDVKCFFFYTRASNGVDLYSPHLPHMVIHHYRELGATQTSIVTHGNTTIAISNGFQSYTRWRPSLYL